MAKKFVYPGLAVLPALTIILNIVGSSDNSLLWTVQIIFGIRGPKPLIWDGKALIFEGLIENIKSFNFTEQDRLFPKENRWECSIGRLQGRAMADRLQGISPREYLEEWVAKGIILELNAPLTASLSIATAGGVFSFNLIDLKLGKPITRLEQNIEIQLLPRTFIFGSKGRMNNYPSIAIDNTGNIWTAYVSYKKGKDRLVLRKYNGQEWGKEIEISDTGCYLQPSLAGDLEGGLWVCWPARVKDNRDIYARHYKDGRWSSIFRLCDHTGPDTNQRIVVEENNRLWVAWQGFGSENADIFMRYWDKGKWSPIIRVTDHQGNDWQPAITTDNKGNIYIAWDTYRNGRHAIILRQLEGRRGRYNSRKIGLICYYGGKFYKPSEDLYVKLPPTMKIYADLPRLQIDSSGRLWLFFHHYIGSIPFYIHDKLMEIWKVYGIFYDGKKWSSPIELGYNTWRNIFASSTCADKEKAGVWIVYPGDNRQNGSRNLDPASICIASLNLEKMPPQNVELILAENQPKFITNASNIKTTPVPKIRYESKLGLKKYKLFWGTLHEEHAVRGRKGMDCFVWDTFKYALHDQQYDFLGIADYAFRDSARWFGTDNYSLWEAKKISSIYLNGGNFLSFYIKEKSPYKRAPGHYLQKNPSLRGCLSLLAFMLKISTKNPLSKPWRKEEIM